MNLQVERVTGSPSSAGTVAKRRTKCRLCPEWIEKGQHRVTSTGIEREWINGEFRNVLKTRHEHAHIALPAEHIRTPVAFRLSCPDSFIIRAGRPEGRCSYGHARIVSSSVRNSGNRWLSEVADVERERRMTECSTLRLLCISKANQTSMDIHSHQTQYPCTTDREHVVHNGCSCSSQMSYT
jgi:hypothetical protein